MRYLLITYIRKPNGQIDEQVEVSKNIRERDITTCNVSMDFKDKVVNKCVVDGLILNKDWDRLYGYYQPIYTSIIERLEAEASQE